MNRFIPHIKRALLIALILFAVTYAGDYAWFRLRLLHPTATNPYEVVKVERFYAIPQKNGRYEFTQADPISQTCVHSIFPHGGYNPCWYVLRQNGTPIPMVFLPFAVNNLHSFGKPAVVARPALAAFFHP